MRKLRSVFPSRRAPDGRTPHHQSLSDTSVNKSSHGSERPQPCPPSIKHVAMKHYTESAFVFLTSQTDQTASTYGVQIRKHRISKLGPRRSRVAGGQDGRQIWRVAAKTMNKQSMTCYKGCTSNMGIGTGASNSVP